MITLSYSLFLISTCVQFLWIFLVLVKKPNYLRMNKLCYVMLLMFISGWDSGDNRNISWCCWRPSWIIAASCRFNRKQSSTCGIYNSRSEWSDHSAGLLGSHHGLQSQVGLHHTHKREADFHPWHAVPTSGSDAHNQSNRQHRKVDWRNFIQVIIWKDSEISIIA